MRETNTTAPRAAFCTLGCRVNQYESDAISASLEADGFQIVPKPFIYTENSRSIGIADMAKAIADNRPHRASKELARHVIEIMFAFERSSAEGKKVEIQSRCERPAPLPLGLTDGELD
jgi:hypothetical protein